MQRFFFSQKPKYLVYLPWADPEEGSRPPLFSGVKNIFQRETTTVVVALLYSPEVACWNGLFIEVQGLLSSLSSFQTIISFIVVTNAMENVQPIASKLRKGLGYIFRVWYYWPDQWAHSSYETRRGGRVQYMVQRCYSFGNTSWYSSYLNPKSTKISTADA